MLPPSHRHHYQEFLKALEQLQQEAQETANLEPAKLGASFFEVQQIFTRQIASLSDDDFNPDLDSRIQSYLTEIDRLLRLLQIDVMFLQASRNPATAKLRLSGMGDRIKTLIGFCVAILQKQ